MEWFELSGDRYGNGKYINNFKIIHIYINVYVHCTILLTKSGFEFPL